MPKLSKHLYDLITGSTKRFNIIQVSETIEVEDGSYYLLFDSDEHTMEIGVSKMIYLKLFKESHTIWTEDYLPRVQANPGFLNDCSLEDLMELYFMTVGYLITTNEHHSAIRLHEVLVMKLHNKLGYPFLNNEFKILTSFATSRLQRINKSSSLWLFIKKLSIVLIFDRLWLDSSIDCAIENYLKIIDCCILSCRLHYSSYYASYFLTFCLKLNTILIVSNIQALKIHSVNSYIFEKLKDACKQKLTDISLWTSLRTYFMEQISITSKKSIKESSIHCYIENEYNRCKCALESQINYPLNELRVNEVYQNSENSSLSIIKELDELILWLLTVKCSIYSPYKLLLGLYSDLDIDLQNHVTIKNAIDEEIKNEKKKASVISIQKDSLYEKSSQYITILDSVISKYFT